jgi:predicted RNA-binding protein with TRAM domain
MEIEVGEGADTAVAEAEATAGPAEGIAKIDGFVIFVAGGKQGQSAKIKITRVTDRFATGEVVTGSGAGATEAASETAGEEQPEA